MITFAHPPGSREAQLPGHEIEETPLPEAMVDGDGPEGARPLEGELHGDGPLERGLDGARSLEPDLPGSYPFEPEPHGPQSLEDDLDDIDRLGDEIARLAAHIHAATYRLLALIRTFDEREGWGNGFFSCAAWLSWRTGIAPGPAREKVRVARALGSLPKISRAMSRGVLSYSKVRALTRVATPENEGDLLELARHATAAQVEKLLRSWRRMDRLEAAEVEEARHRARFLDLRPDEDGSWVLRGRLDPEVGALLQKALEWGAEALYRGDASDTETVTPAQRRADAVALLAERALAAEETDEDTGPGPGPATRPMPLGRADRFQVVLHVDAEALSLKLPSPASILTDGGVGVPAGTSRRHSGDAGLVEMHQGGTGNVLNVGRRRRTVPPSIRRALDHRDGNCRFPGCGCRYTDAHHIVHWAAGGETKLDNLILLCGRHHRVVHEEGFRVEVVESENAGIGFRFLRPDGRPIPEVPETPPPPPDPLKALEEAHTNLGVEPDPWTPTPLWNGDPFDCGLALDVLRQPAGFAPLNRHDEWSHSQYGLRYALSPYAAEGLETLFQRMEAQER